MLHSVTGGHLAKQYKQLILNNQQKYWMHVSQIFLTIKTLC